jgi:hypothetical protein
VSVLRIFLLYFTYLAYMDFLCERDAILSNANRRLSYFVACEENAMAIATVHLPFLISDDVGSFSIASESKRGFAANNGSNPGTWLALHTSEQLLVKRGQLHMTKIRTRYSVKVLAVLGLSCVCMAASPARSAGPAGVEGGVTAYQFAGVYSGSSQLFATKDESCHPGIEVAVEVRNGRLRMPWNDRQIFDASISRDGSFYATSGAPVVQAEKHMTLVPTLQGRISSAGLVADYGTRFCHYRLEATQSASVQHLSQRAEDSGTRQ